jgi:hypothetical protein
MNWLLLRDKHFSIHLLLTTNKAGATGIKIFPEKVAIQPEGKIKDK